MHDGDASSQREWGNVRFGRTGIGGHASFEDPGATRFAIGLTVFLVVALVMPWYSYWVVTRLLAADATAALEQMTQEADAESARMRSEMEVAKERQRELLHRDRLSRVSVRGFSEGSGSMVVIVDLGAASLSEATPAICAQVRRLRGAGTYEGLRVRKFRGSAPAQPVGTIQCVD